MGMNPCKEGAIELYNAAAYLECRSLWGVGGVIIHEFAHAFHNKHCPDGYECSDIREVLHIDFFIFLVSVWDTEFSFSTDIQHCHEEEAV
jgi:hypothetical protein